MNGRRMFATWEHVDALLAEKRINLEPIITHVVPLAEFRRGFELMKRGDAIKVLIDVQAV